jgi:hypothetical protein
VLERKTAFVGLGGALLLAACTTVLGYEPGQTIVLAPDAGDAGPMADPFAGRSLASDATSPVAPEAGSVACRADLNVDPRNCGRCGHACETTCVEGRCVPRVLVPNAGFTISGFQVRGARGYIGDDDDNRARAAGLRCKEYLEHHVIRSFDTAIPGPLLVAGGLCYDRFGVGGSRQGRERWLAAPDGLYVWKANLTYRQGTYTIEAREFDSLGTLKVYRAPLPVGVDPNEEGEQVLPSGSRPLQLAAADPASMSEYLLFFAGGYRAVANGSVGPLRLVPGTDFRAGASATATEVVGATSIFSSSSFVVAQRECDAGTGCSRQVDGVAPSACGFRRVGNTVLTCTVQADGQDGPYNLLLHELDLGTGISRLANVAPLVERAGNGTAVLSPMLLADDGVFVVRGLQIDFLPRSGPPVPISLSQLKPAALALDSGVLFWHDGVSIYRTVP